MKFQFVSNTKIKPSIRFFNNQKDYDQCNNRHKFLLNKTSHGYLDTLDSFSMIKSILNNSITNTIVCDMTHLTMSQKASFAFMASKHFFNFSQYKTNQDKVIVMQFLDLIETKKFWNSICNKIISADIAKVLASEPSNIVYPEEFCKRVKDIFKNNVEMNIKIYDEKQMEKMELGLIVGVGKGSEKKPRFLIMDLNNKNKNKTICICGKGVCFDSGGYDLKGNMKKMHGDKSGGALVVGLLHYFTNFKKTKNRLVGIIPLVENLINGQAAKTSDILTAYDKQTIEILDTDAEGRLILADSIAYACKNYKPDMILDFATLSTFASYIHCDASYVFYCNNDKLGALVNKIGTSIGERNVKMPNWPEYMRYTKSTVADLKNADYKCKNGNTGGGGYMAAMFMMNFLNPHDLKWIHFDMALNNNVDNPYLSEVNGIYTGMYLLDS